MGYGYKWWIPEDPEGDFLAIGIWGQCIYVHPRYNIVIAKTATDYYFDNNDHENIVFFRSVARAMAKEHIRNMASTKGDRFFSDPEQMFSNE